MKHPPPPRFSGDCCAWKHLEVQERVPDVSRIADGLECVWGVLLGESWGTDRVSEHRLQRSSGFQMEEFGVYILLCSLALWLLWDSSWALNHS